MALSFSFRSFFSLSHVKQRRFLFPPPSNFPLMETIEWNTKSPSLVYNIVDGITWRTSRAIRRELTRDERMVFEENGKVKLIIIYGELGGGRQEFYSLLLIICKYILLIAVESFARAEDE